MAKARLPRGAFTNLLSKTSAPVLLLLRYTVAYVILERIMSWDGFMVAANVSTCKNITLLGISDTTMYMCVFRSRNHELT